MLLVLLALPLLVSAQSGPNPYMTNFQPPQSQSQEPLVPLQPNFDGKAYLGKWFELYRTKNIPYQSPYATDVTASYTPNPNGTFTVLNKEWLPTENRWNSATALAYMSDPSVARAVVQFPNSPIPGDYRVLMTDYTNVAVVLSMHSYNGVLTKYVWILGRKTLITDNVAAMAFALIRERVDLSPTAFQRTVHGVAPSDDVAPAQAAASAPAPQPSFFRPQMPQQFGQMGQPAYQPPQQQQQPQQADQQQQQQPFGMSPFFSMLPFIQQQQQQQQQQQPQQQRPSFPMFNMFGGQSPFGAQQQQQDQPDQADDGKTTQQPSQQLPSFFQQRFPGFFNTF